MFIKLGGGWLRVAGLGNATPNPFEGSPIAKINGGRTIIALEMATSGRFYEFEGNQYYVVHDRMDLDLKLEGYKYLPDQNSYHTQLVEITDDADVSHFIPLNNLVTTRVNTFNDLLFDTNNKFNQDVSSWDTSNVTNMERVFRASTHFDQDLSKWDTSKVTTFRGMFQYCDDFNQDITGWDTSSATDLSEMFDGAATFNQDISGWDTSSVVNTSRMFLSSPIAIDLSMWCVPNVTDYTDFATYAPNMTPEFTPVWGTCPSFIAARTSTNGTGETL
jgi:surface protein